MNAGTEVVDPLTDAEKLFAECYIRKEWWTVTTPKGTSREVFFCPPQALAEIRTNWPRYAKCTVEAML